MTEKTALYGAELFDLNIGFGAYVTQRLDNEKVIWLTTVGTNGMPQPRPVRFIWHDGSFIIFSMPTAHKIRHIEQNPKVALHFDGGETGEDVAVFLCEAQIEVGPFPEEIVDAYLAKYAVDIFQRGFSMENYIKPDFIMIRVTPTKLRGAW